MNWAHFQLLLLGAAAGIFACRIVWLHQKTGIRVTKMSHPSEAGFVLGECIVVALILRNSGMIAFPLPEILDKSVIVSEPVRWIGGVLLIASVVLFAVALFAMGTSWRIGIDRQTPGRLVTTGVFHRSRNPIFLFMAFYVFGTFLINGTVIFLIAVAVTAVFLHFQVLREERFMAGQYGDEYGRYCQHVPRYF